MFFEVPWFQEEQVFDPETRAYKSSAVGFFCKIGGIAMECLIDGKAIFSVEIVCAKIVGPNPDEELKIRYVDVRAGVAAALTKAPDAFAVREWVRGGQGSGMTLIRRTPTGATWDADRLTRAARRSSPGSLSAGGQIIAASSWRFLALLRRTCRTRR